MNGEHFASPTGGPSIGRRPGDYESVTVFRRISWGALFAGVAAALGIQLLLTSLGAAIGLSVADFGKGGGQGGDGGTAAIVAGIWWLVVAAASLFVGGWVAARLTGSLKNLDGMVHGFLTWSITALIGLWAVTSGLSSVLGGTLSLASNLAGAAQEAAQPYVEDMQSTQSGSLTRAEFWRDVRTDIEKATSAAGTGQVQTATPDSAQQEIMATAREAFRADQSQLQPADRNELIHKMETTAGLERTRAEQMVSDWESSWGQVQSQARTVASPDVQYDTQQLKERGAQAADKAVDYAAGAMWWVFFSMLVGAGAAVAGGRVGAPADPVA